MSAFTKIVAGISTVGAVGGGVALGAYSLINTQNIQGKLREEGYETLDTETDTGWQTILEAYKKATKNTFETKDKLNAETTQGLRKKCKDALIKKAETEKDYLLARQWCVKERTAKDIFEKLGLRELKTDATPGTTTNPDDTTWTNLAKNYKTEGAKNKIVIAPEPAGDVDKEKIKAACKTLIAELKTTTDGFNEKLEQAKEWCTIAKTKPAS